MLSKPTFLYKINVIIHSDSTFFESASKSSFGVQLSHFGLVHFVVSITFVLSGSIVCHALKGSLRGNDRVHRNSLVTSETIKLSREVTLNKIVIVTRKPLSPPKIKGPPSNSTFNLDIQSYCNKSEAVGCCKIKLSLAEKQSPCISKDRLKCRWEGMILGKLARCVSKPLISIGFSKGWCVQKHTNSNTWFDFCLISEFHSLCSISVSFLLKNSGNFMAIQLKSPDWQQRYHSFFCMTISSFHLTSVS